MNSQYRHKRLVDSTSICIADLPKLSRARKVSTEADIVVSFVKSRNCSSNFEKKFYLKRNSDIVEQRICYNTQFEVANKKEFIKVLKLVADVEPLYLQKSVERGCINEASCTSFAKTNLLSILAVNDRNSNASKEQNFVLKSVSYDSYCSKYTEDDQTRKSANKKIAAIKNIISRQKEQKKIGDLYFEYTNECDKNVSFYVIMQCFEKATLKSSNLKQRMKKSLLTCSQEIRKYLVPTSVDSEQSSCNYLQELLSLDMKNWKVLDYQFKSSKDEAFYKQIRRRNRDLTEV